MDGPLHESIAFSLFFLIILLTLGPPLPKAIRGISMLYINGVTYAIGGASMNGYESSIYQLSCYFGLCSWTTLIQQVKVGTKIQQTKIAVTKI